MRVASIFASLVLSGLTFAAAAKSATVVGVWMTEHRDAKIRIAPCGAALCGSIVWLAKPKDESGRPVLDPSNPDPAKRSRPILGLTILTGLTKSGEEWRGRIYNSDDGKDYDVQIALIDAQHASVKGCAPGGIFCGGETWTRE